MFRKRRLVSRGMTLIELMVVSTILAMAAAAIVVAFQPMLTRTQFETFVRRLKEIDDFTRRASHLNSNDLNIEFDLSLQKIVYSRLNEGVLYEKTVEVPRGIRLAEVLGGIDESGTRVVIPIKNGGYSGNYGISIDSNGERKWLLFYGGSGEVKEVQGDNEIRTFFPNY